MGGRYIITGVQIGMLKLSMDNKKTWNQIINNQFIGDSNRSIKEDVTLIKKMMRVTR